MTSFIARLVVSAAWVIPFGIVTDYGLADWQWWLMMFGVLAYHKLRIWHAAKFPERSYRPLMTRHQGEL